MDTITLHILYRNKYRLIMEIWRDFLMYPTIDRKATGACIRQIMAEQNITVRKLQEYLGLFLSPEHLPLA